MKEYKRKHLDQRFSLHDANIIDIDFDLDCHDLILKTQYGFVDINKNEMVEGEIILKDISLEDSCVYIMEYKNVLAGNVGSFVGEKMDLQNFISAFYTKFKNIDVVSEYDSYKTYLLTGFLSRGDEYLEVNIEIFYQGDFLYRVTE